LKVLTDLRDLMAVSRFMADVLMVVVCSDGGGL
jgi:hypothetical protein